MLSLLSSHNAAYGGEIRAQGFTYDLAIANGNVAAGRSLDINANSLGADESLTFDGSAELDGSFRIFGGAGNDVALGGAQADRLYGGLGADRHDGGAGADLYIYRSVLESRAGSADSLTFAAGDRIDLSFIDADPASQANDSFAFIGEAAFSGTAGELRVAGSGGAWTIEADQDGDGLADLIIEVASPQPLIASDFLL